MRAKRLGIQFQRAATFKIPNSIVINGDRKLLSLPDEEGIKVAFVEIFLDDCYGLKQLPPSIHKILDIGANVGLFSVAARHQFPQALIHAYEPNPHLENYLQLQAHTVGFDYFMEAVGLSEGKVSLEFNQDSVLTRSRVEESGEIPQVAFSKAIERLGGAVDLAKIDCEGAEWLLFQNPEAWQSIQNLSMEYHLFQGQKHDQVRQIIQNLGFQVKQQIPIENYGLLLAFRQ
ncbi:MAG: FkbM family methyltransferase [Cyanobacteriota bacterium]